MHTKNDILEYQDLKLILENLNAFSKKAYCVEVLGQQLFDRMVYLCVSTWQARHAGLI